MRLRNRSIDDLVKLEPSPTGGFELHDGAGVTYMTTEGAEQFGACARIFEELRPVLEAWTEHFAAAECPHGVRFDAEDDGGPVFEWHVNDYCFDLLTEPDQAVMIFYGYHWHLGDDDWFCLPAWFMRSPGAFTWDASYLRAREQGR